MGTKSEWGLKDLIEAYIFYAHYIEYLQGESKTEVDDEMRPIKPGIGRYELMSS